MVEQQYRQIVNTEYLIFLLILLRVSRLPALGRMMIVCCEFASSTIINSHEHKSTEVS